MKQKLGIFPDKKVENDGIEGTFSRYVRFEEAINGIRKDRKPAVVSLSSAEGKIGLSQRIISQLAIPDMVGLIIVPAFSDPGWYDYLKERLISDLPAVSEYQGDEASMVAHWQYSQFAPVVGSHTNKPFVPLLAEVDYYDRVYLFETMAFASAIATPDDLSEISLFEFLEDRFQPSSPDARYYSIILKPEVITSLVRFAPEVTGTRLLKDNLLLLPVEYECSKVDSTGKEWKVEKAKYEHLAGKPVSEGISWTSRLGRKMDNILRSIESTEDSVFIFAPVCLTSTKVSKSVVKANSSSYDLNANHYIGFPKVVLTGIPDNPGFYIDKREIKYYHEQWTEAIRDKDMNTAVVADEHLARAWTDALAGVRLSNLKSRPKYPCSVITEIAKKNGVDFYGYARPFFLGVLGPSHVGKTTMEMNNIDTYLINSFLGREGMNLSSPMKNFRCLIHKDEPYIPDNDSVDVKTPDSQIPEEYKEAIAGQTKLYDALLNPMGFGWPSYRRFNRVFTLKGLPRAEAVVAYKLQAQLDVYYTMRRLILAMEKNQKQIGNGKYLSESIEPRLLFEEIATAFEFKERGVKMNIHPNDNEAFDDMMDTIFRQMIVSVILDSATAIMFSSRGKSLAVSGGLSWNSRVEFIKMGAAIMLPIPDSAQRQLFGRNFVSPGSDGIVNINQPTADVPAAMSLMLLKGSTDAVLEMKSHDTIMLHSRHGDQSTVGEAIDIIGNITDAPIEESVQDTDKLDLLGRVIENAWPDGTE